MPKSKILIIEGDIDLNDLLSLRLKACDYQIFSLLDFKGAENLLDSEQIDLLMVDRNLPSGDSLDRIKESRKQGYKEAVILLIAKTLHQDLLEGFESDCDDYMCKPSDFDELLLRIKAILKRHKRGEGKLVLKDFSLDLINYEFLYKNEKLDVSNLEYELLKCFFENPNTLLTQQFLSENVWKDDTIGGKTINVALTGLRNKFPKLKEHTIGVRGIGYKMY